MTRVWNKVTVQSNSYEKRKGWNSRNKYIMRLKRRKHSCFLAKGHHDETMSEPHTPAHEDAALGDEMHCGCSQHPSLVKKTDESEPRVWP